MSSLRVLYFGMPVEFSIPPLRRLIESGLDVHAVVVPETAAGLATGAQPGLRRAEPGPDAFVLHTSPFGLLASGLRLIRASNLAAVETLDLIAALRPDVICVACFPMIFPPPLVALPPLGCLNLHPSLLPRWRGPAPLFWQFHAGETQTGVTVHFMDRGVDTGDIALQRPVVFPDGLGGDEVDRLCAEAGGELMVEAVRLLEEGRCPRVRQSASGVTPTSAPWPSALDFEISRSWPVRRAFNFVCGTVHWGMLYKIQVGEELLSLRRACSFSEGERLGQLWRRGGNEVAVQFPDGVARFETSGP